jgi:hypothetical protein
VKRRIIQKLLRLYPPQWRDEYGTELEDLLLAEPLQPAVVLNVIANALRQQVRISNHPPSAVRFLTFVLRVSFAFGALLCGLHAMGYWVILQVGGVPPAESGGIALVVYRSVFWFVIQFQLNTKNTPVGGQLGGQFSSETVSWLAQQGQILARPNGLLAGSFGLFVISFEIVD